jgi:hypothetical protein
MARLDDLLGPTAPSTLPTAEYEALNSTAAAKDIRPRFRHVSPLVISYEEESDGFFAKDLAAQLRIRGKECWTANSKLRGGVLWNREIYKRIDECAELIVVVSAASIQSEFVAAEVQFAFKCGKRVIALHLEPNLTPEWLDLRLGTVHRIDWFKNANAFDDLVVALAD